MISRAFDQTLDGAAAAQPRGLSLATTILLAGLVVIAVECLLLLTSNSGVLHGVLFDPDCYMHLQRALQLMTGGGGPDPRINAPYGFAIHWTSLFDFMLVLGAEPLHLLGLDPHAALYLWGSAISPLLLIFGLGILAWGVRPMVSGASFLWLTILLFTQPQLSGAFLAGRPDHHSLILALLLAQLGCLYAVLDGRAGTKAAIAAGLFAGVQICTTVEGLLCLLFVSAVLGIAWAVYGRPVIRLLAVYLGACLACVLVWLAAGHGASWLQPAYDRVSMVHVLVIGAGIVSVAALGLLEPRLTGKNRIAAMAFTTVAAASFIAFVFPDFFLGPWPHIDPEIKAWHTTISELQPLLPTDLRHGAQFLAEFTAALLSLPLLSSRLRHGGKGEQMAMLTCLVGLVLFGGLALAQMRWSGEVQAMILLPWTLTTRALMQSRLAARIGKTRVPLRSFLLAGALLLQLAPGALYPMRALANPLTTSSSIAACDWERAIPALSSLRPSNAILLTELWYGPEILWRTDLRVVAGPYEIAPALRDTRTALEGSESAARTIVQRRQINFLLVCGAAPGFAGQLQQGAVPGWLQPLPLGLPGFHLYQVRRG